MGKKKVNIKSLLFLFFILLSIYSHSQELFTKELKWNYNDSIKNIVFKNTDEINDWGLSLSSFATVQTETFHIKNCDVYFLIVDKCSGIYCASIYVFEERNKLWQLVTSSQAKLKEKIEIIMDNNQEKIIFKTKNVRIGELSFEKVNLKLND